MLSYTPIRGIPEGDIMKRRSAAASASSENWLLTQWAETVHTLQTRPPSRRGQMLITDEALENCLDIVSSASEGASSGKSSEMITLLT